MERGDNTRRTFLKTSAGSAALAAGLSASDAALAALSSGEAQHWQACVGEAFESDGALLRLVRVDAVDHSREAARPANLRSQSVSLLFRSEQGAVDGAAPVHLSGNGRVSQLSLQRVLMPPQPQGEFYEAILN